MSSLMHVFFSLITLSLQIESYLNIPLIMKYRSLGNNEKLSAIGLGCMSMSHAFGVPNDANTGDRYNEANLKWVDRNHLDQRIFCIEARTYLQSE